MSKHSSDSRSRRTKKALALHAELRQEIEAARKPEPSKIDRKRAASLLFRTQAI